MKKISRFWNHWKKTRENVFTDIVSLSSVHWLSCGVLQRFSMTIQIQDFFYETKRIIASCSIIKHTRKWQHDLYYLSDITVPRNKKIPKPMQWKVYCNLTRQVELHNIRDSAKIRTKHNTIKNNDSMHLFLAWINMQKIFLIIHRVIHSACNKKKTYSKRVFSILIKLEFLFSLGNIPFEFDENNTKLTKELEKLCNLDTCSS